ncbi:MAG: hypothetical protein WDW38_000315 [Sanguina aurantia]
MGQLRPGNSCSVLGPVRIPARYSWVLQLALTHVMVPQASFTGHMCGVVAGLLQGFVVSPALGALLHNRKSRDFGSGTTGGKAVRRHRVRWLLAAATQVSLAVAATAVYVIASRVQGRMQRQSVRAPTNLWDRLLSSSSR